MDDETQVVPTDGSTEAPVESTQTAETAVVTPETQAPPALSLEQVERLLNEREQKLRAEFEQTSRKMQSKTDKAYANALRKGKVIEETAELLGLDAEQVKAAKQALVDKEFTAAFNEPNPQAQADATAQVPNVPPSDTVSRAELEQYLTSQGLDAGAIDLSKYDGVRRGDTKTEKEFLDDVAIARAEIAKAERLKKQQTAQAKQTQEVKQQFGKVSAPTAGAPSAGYDPKAELEKLLEQDPGNDPAAHLEKLRKLRGELEARGLWKQ